MAQYQSFPEAPGDSRTLDKLKALRLPSLSGKRFLDVGCNEGFFCGYAAFDGASRAVGIDQSALFIDRARKRFPKCEFHQQGWDQLPEGPYDVILLASALHYADDQPALIRRLVDNLAPGGILVLELGIASSPKAEWTRIKRGIDERYFPSMPQLKETLAEFAWKWVGKSVNQDGDPVGRHVLHISRRLPVAYLLMLPPAYGKSSIASRLFAPAGVPLVSGDQVLSLIADGKLDVPEPLRQVVAKDYSAFTLDATLQRVFDNGLGRELVQAWIAQSAGGDFALDSFVPKVWHQEVEQRLADAGYLPVTLSWERPAPSLLPLAALDQRAEDYYRALAKGKRTAEAPVASDVDMEERGYVDELRLQDGILSIRGWAMDRSGQLPERLVIGIGNKRTFVDIIHTELRHDVQKHLELPHARLGYKVQCSVAEFGNLANVARKDLSVTFLSGKPLNLARSIEDTLAAGGPL